MGSSLLKPPRYQAKFNAMNFLRSFKDTRSICRVMVILVLLVFSIKSELIAQADYNCYIKNIVQTAPNTLEFDIWLESTGPDTFKLTFIQAGVDFNLTGIANGGALTGIMVPEVQIQVFQPANKPIRFKSIPPRTNIVLQPPWLTLPQQQQ
ncbi:MAG: hypothetical protein HWD58_04485 [Bacteroidota bacterium]|nr:MAG: hypothetical protein HWD58_04485 [Bacteroidota bacterium]